MARHIEDDVAYYYDFHPTEEDLMGETSVHRSLISYLGLVLSRLFHDQACAIYENLNFYQTANPNEYPLAPDIVVIKGVTFRHLRSWRVGKSGPAPQVVFEIASEETWKKDLDEKPMKYALMGVQEYFAYDPYNPPLRRDASQSLFGWQLDTGTRQMKAMPVGPGGRLWSVHLESFLVPEGEYLRLYDRYGHRHLTQAEAEAEARKAETRRAEAEAEIRKAETRRAEAEAKRAEVLAEKLRSLGIDPDDL